MKGKIVLISVLLSILWLPVMAQNQGVSDPVREFAVGGSVDSTSVAVMVLDLKTGRTTGSYRADAPMVPASVMKCVTTATLLKQVGHDWRYETPVYITGRVRARKLEGNLVVEGSADPSVNSRQDLSPDIIPEIIAALRRHDIDSIMGAIVVDESRFKGEAINPGWAQGDLSQAYGTGTHAFNFEDNASGSASVRDPGAVFRSRLTSALSRAGIAVGSTPLPDGRRTLITVHKSATVDEIMRSCMMRSDNQYAESMLRTVSRNAGKDGSVAAGADFVMNYWKSRRIPADSVRIVDGSGLSRSNRLTARFLAQLLRKMATNNYYASFFPLAGHDGTLRKFLAGTRLDGYVALKTGSMNGIQSYAGYKLDDNFEPTHVIVVMVNNMADRARARAGIQKMLEALF